jgi:hypothetical protein
MSQIKLTNDQIKIVSGVGAGVVALIVGGLLWKSSRSKEEPEYVEDSDEFNEVIERPSEASTVDLNIRNNRDNDDDEEEGWKTGTGGKRSRRRRKNKSKKSRSKSKRRTKK